jgi:hypothetical protein
MKRTTAVLAGALLSAIGFFGVHSVYTDYRVWDKGMWPESWPRELEPLRKQARTFEGPLDADRRYLIPFTKREDFESAWPHLLKVKSKGAPIILVRAPKTDFFEVKPAGVLVKCPPARTDKFDNQETPLSGQRELNPDHAPTRTLPRVWVFVRMGCKLRDSLYHQQKKLLDAGHQKRGRRLCRELHGKRVGWTCHKMAASLTSACGNTLI